MSPGAELRLQSHEGTPLKRNLGGEFCYLIGTRFHFEALRMKNLSLFTGRGNRGTMAAAFEVT